MTLTDDDSSIEYSEDKDNVDSSIKSSTKAIDNDTEGCPDDQGPFNIVLVDIRKTAEQRRVYCEEVELLGSQKVEYMTLSYRWGEMNEQVVRATDDYDAHVTSFLLNDFLRLCRRIMREPDLKKIKYVWVDAICIDQRNEKSKKDTIYRMNDIYENAAYIVAVPDLNMQYWLNVSKAYARMWQKIKKYRWYIYYAITENIEGMDRLDEEWMDTLGIPVDDKSRHTLKTSLNLKSKRDSDDEEEEEMNACREISFKKDIQNTDDYYENMQNWLIKYQRNAWKRLEKKRRRQILNALEHLTDLFGDWANRTWVISEYHIAKKHNDGKMKYWFIHLNSEHIFHDEYFFTFDFNDQSIPPSQSFRRLIYLAYHLTIKKKMIYRSFVDKILNSRASRNEDRFHAMLPLLPKYNKIIRTKDTISSWNITDMTSVRLKLYEILDPMDKFQLFYCSSYMIRAVLPTFASNFNEENPAYTMRIFMNHPVSEYNFDITDHASIILETHPSYHMNHDYQGPCLHVRPKRYYMYQSTESSLEEMDGLKRYNRSFRQLGLECTPDSLTLVKILAIFRDEDQDQYCPKLAVRLLGSIKRNIWILCSFDDTKFESQRHINTDYIFHVY
ncbi:uncharacterized protein BX664DRAFT_337067 [Halteromyces radiatus]|uniref:uncharacterized protein n=1 Tax=Halteromyces radiatus TaxID=101107 RepID=UPI00221E62D1|nr:uncharacterized protein BX664DRAFT_337067 [Halteromyces radiatus]KAI8084470.1 hypothetical protein BX664DRAFT_337067 [Halteromyces radiatus]